MRQALIAILICVSLLAGTADARETRKRELEPGTPNPVELQHQRQHLNAYGTAVQAPFARSPGARRQAEQLAAATLPSASRIRAPGRAHGMAACRSG
jgi:hypothetical protein